MFFKLENELWQSVCARRTTLSELPVWHTRSKRETAIASPESGAAAFKGKTASTKDRRNSDMVTW